MTMTKKAFSATVMLCVLSAAGSAAAVEGAFCAGLQQQVDRWQAYLAKQGTPNLKHPAGILAYGDTVTNGNERLLRARHKTDVSTIFVLNPSADFVRVVTSVPDGVPRSRQTAAGTTLGRDSAACNNLINGTTYCAPVILFGHNYDSLYVPVFENSKVIGALYVGDASQ